MTYFAGMRYYFNSTSAGATIRAAAALPVQVGNSQTRRLPAGMHQPAAERRLAADVARQTPARGVEPRRHFHLGALFLGRRGRSANSRFSTAAQSRCTSRTTAPIWASL